MHPALCVSALRCRDKNPRHFGAETNILEILECIILQRIPLFCNHICQLLSQSLKSTILQHDNCIIIDDTPITYVYCLTLSWLKNHIRLVTLPMMTLQLSTHSTLISIVTISSAMPFSAICSGLHVMCTVGAWVWHYTVLHVTCTVGAWVWHYTVLHVTCTVGAWVWHYTVLHVTCTVGAWVWHCM